MSFCKEVLLARFDVVLSYDLGNGTRVEKGGERFAEWPGVEGQGAARRAARGHSRAHALSAVLRQPRAAETGARTRVAVIVRNAGLIVPPSAGGANYELSAIASQLRDWAADPSIAEQHCATFLLTENLNDLHPLVAQNPQAARIVVPLPAEADLAAGARASECALSDAAASRSPANLSEPAAALAGATLHSIETLLQTREHHQQAAHAARSRRAEEGTGRKGCPGPHRVRQTRPHAR